MTIKKFSSKGILSSYGEIQERYLYYGIHDNTQTDKCPGFFSINGLPLFDLQVKGNFKGKTNKIAVVLELLDSLIRLIPIKHLGYDSDSSHLGISYHENIGFIKKVVESIWETVAAVEGQFKLSPFTPNPAMFLSNAIRPLEAKELLSIDKLKNSKVLVSYSGGKESTFLTKILDHFKIKYDKVSIFDAYQGRDRVDTFDFQTSPEQILLGNIAVTPTFKSNRLTEYNEPNEYIEEFGHSYFLPIVIIQRLAVMLLGIDYDYVLFGDEAERHQIYRTNTGIYPTHDFFQTQYFYNLLNLSGIFGKSKMYTPLTNFSQFHILKYVVSKGTKLNSCWKYDNSWCNECRKCRRIGFMLQQLFGSKFTQFKGYEGLKYYDYSEDNAESMLGVFSPKDHKKYEPSHVYYNPVISVLDKFIVSIENACHSGETIPDSILEKPLTHPLLKVWNEDSLNKIVGFLKEL